MIKHRRLVYLNTANRASGVDASNFQIQVPISSHETFTHVCLVEASIPKSYYLIQAGFNTFTLMELGQPITITLVPGNYTATCFRTCVANAMTAGSTHGWTYTVTAPGATDPNTGKFTYTVANNTGQPSIVCTTNVYEQLGFNANSTNTFVGNTLVSSNVVRFISEDALYIHSDIVTGEGDDVLQEVYTAGVPDNGLINYKCLDWQIMSKPTVAKKGNVFRFALTDENARVMNLNGLDWNMTLMFLTVEENSSITPP
jgi:hypothetical protein